jgi:hypothetical protein
MLPGMNTRPSPIPLRPDYAAADREARRTLHRMLAATALAELTNTPVDKLVARIWPSDTLTPVNPTTTGTAAALANTVTGPALTGVAPASAAARLFEHPRIIQLDFKGVHQYSIPRGSLTPVPIFIGEGAPMPMSQAALNATIVGPTKKILLGTAISNELEFFSGNTAASVLGTIIAEQSALSLDAVVFDALPGDALRPAGLLNGVTPIAATGAGGNTPGGCLKVFMYSLPTKISWKRLQLLAGFVRHQFLPKTSHTTPDGTTDLLPRYLLPRLFGD